MKVNIRILHSYKEGDQRPSRSVRDLRELAESVGRLAFALGRPVMVVSSTVRECAVVVGWLGGQDAWVMVCLGRVERVRLEWRRAALVLPWSEGWFRRRSGDSLRDSVEFGRERWGEAGTLEAFFEVWGATRPRFKRKVGVDGTVAGRGLCGDDHACESGGIGVDS